MISSASRLRHHQGFTLLELLIAMVIFSFMTVMAYGALNNILTSNEVITAQEKKLKKLQRAMMIIDRDLHQIVSRPRQSGYNQPTQAFIAGQDNEGLIEFTRAGNPNPLGLIRSSLQRVQYDVQDKTLIRKSWNLVDHIEAEPVAMPLLNEVESLKFRFLGKDNSWKNGWSEKILVPKAIEIILEHKHWGKVIRLISIQ